MSGLPRVHAASVSGRIRTDCGLLLLMALVVALTTALTAAVAPVTEHTADRAIAATVHAAGSRSAVAATLPEWYDDPRGKTRDPATAVQVRQDADYAQQALPSGLADVLRPGITSVTTPALHLQDAGPGRYLQLAYVDATDGAPDVSYTRGGPPRGSVGDGSGDGSWPVQVAVSESVAGALDLQVGDRVPAEDEHGRSVEVRISGTFVPNDQDDDVWQVSVRLLHPAQGLADGLAYASAAALVSSESLPDLRFGLPGDDLTRRVSFTPEPLLLRWRETESLERSIVSLQASGGLARGNIVWDSLLGSVLRDGRAQVASARGQAQVLLVGLLGCAALVLVLGAQLLVGRRRGPLSMVRQRGATLPGIAAELLLEALLVAVVGTVVGLGAVRLLVGSAGWGWSVPVLVVAMTAAPVLGAVAGASTGARKIPANRTARRTATRALRLRRFTLEGAVLAAAVLSLVALRQRGVVGQGASGGDLMAASAPTWCAVSGAVVLLRLLPPALRSVLRGARRSPGSVGLFVAARLAETGARALPVLVAVVAIAQISLGVAMAVTERQGQRAGALSAVGGDARLDADPDAALDLVARDVDGARGVRAAATGRVEDGVRVSSRHGAGVVRLVVVDAAAYQRLLEVSQLADAPQLARLRASGTDRVPALLLRGSDDLRDELLLRWEDTNVAVDVVGTAPDVNASIVPVLVVDTRAVAEAGMVAPPDTIWAVGPGAGEALDAAAAKVPTVDSVVRYVDELDRRRDAPLPSALITLAISSSALILALAMLGTLLGAAADAPARAESFGRLRALGLPQRDVRRVLVGELVVPVAVAGLAGLALGVGCAYAVLGSLSLELVTGQPGPPVPVVPWWAAVAVAVLVGTALVVSGLEWRRVRRQALAQLLRS